MLLSSGLASANGSRGTKKQGTARPSVPVEKIIVEPSRNALMAFASLQTKAPGDIAATWNDRGFPRAVYGKLGSYGGATAEAARVFLSANSALFDLRADVSDLVLVDAKETPGGTHYTFQQMFDGLKVLDGTMSVNFDTDGAISVVGGDYFGGISVDSTSPEISAEDARLALASTTKRGTEAEPLVNELVVAMDDAHRARLAYHIIQPTTSAKGAAETYEVLVDARTGAIFGKKDINRYASGKVFARGNAIAASGNAALEDNSTIPTSAYQTVTLLGLTSTTGLIGNYVNVYTTTAAANRATPDANGDYLFNRSTTVATGSKFDSVNVYYFVDDAQRYIQSLGFTNVNNRVVRFAINGTTDDNSWYQPNGSGTGDLTMGSGGVDDSEDAEVVLHEYGHSIHDNSKPGMWGGSVTGAMGEGWGDYLANSVLGQRHGQETLLYGSTKATEAVMEWDASAYSSANPPTIRSITSTKHYPENWANEVHDDGEMWSSTLWQIRNDFISQSGSAATGAQRADKVFLQSHFLITSSSATFVDGANTVLQAAINLGYSTAEQTAIRNRFTARGMAPTIGGGTCTYSISPSSASPGSAATTGSVSVTAGSGCTWTASSNASWLTVTSGASGTGNGTVGYSVAANTGAARNGTITIAGQTFTVNQAAGSTTCSSSTTAITSSGSGTLATTDCSSTIRTGGRYYDNFTFSATAGTTYTITLDSSAFDAFLHLLNPSGTSVASDDDGNGGTNSKITYTPSTSGTYTIHATSYAAGATGAYTVTLAGGTSGPVTVLSEGAESGAAGWTYSTNVTGNNWVVNANGRRTGSNGFRSNQAAATYANSLDQSVVSPSFSLSGKTQASLSFYYKQQTESGYDYFKVEVSTNGGSTWTNVSNVAGASTGFTTTAGSGMVVKTISLNSYAGQANVKIRFRLTSDTSVTQWGVAVDDIAVTAQ